MYTIAKTGMTYRQPRWITASSHASSSARHPAFSAFIFVGYYTLDTANVPAHESFSDALARNRPIRPYGRTEFEEAEKRGISLR